MRLSQFALLGSELLRIFYGYAIETIDLMMGIPSEDADNWYDFIKPMLMDEESHSEFKMPAQYMFKDILKVGKQADYIEYVVKKIDKFNVLKGMIGVDDSNAVHQEALRRFPHRFFSSYEANPNQGMQEVRKIRRLHKEYGLKVVTAFAAGLCPQVAINDKKWYSLCIDLQIPFAPVLECLDQGFLWLRRKLNYRMRCAGFFQS